MAAPANPTTLELHATRAFLDTVDGPTANGYALSPIAVLALKMPRGTLRFVPAFVTIHGVGRDAHVCCKRRLYT